jgi:hypothetical protein
MYPDKGIRCESLTRLFISHSHVSDPLTVTTFLADVFPNLFLHHNYLIRTGMVLDDYEHGPEYIEMVACWMDVDQMLEVRRQELSQSLTNPNVHMQSCLQLQQVLKKFPM